jgi:hypothetical protein
LALHLAELEVNAFTMGSCSVGEWLRKNIVACVK